MTARPRVGVLGGTFDPVHNGHLAAARAAGDALALARLLFIPAARPPHRPDSPRASEYHRVEMIRRAIGGRDGWEVSDLELRRPGPSYTIDTLLALHREGVTPLQTFFITGADAFAEIATWRRYPDVLDAAHMVVVTRPGFTLDALRARLPDLADRMSRADDAANAPCPRIILIESATPDVSSTEVRQRAASGEPLKELVPDAVAAYIEQHGLYRHAHRPSPPAAPKEPTGN